MMARADAPDPRLAGDLSAGDEHWPIRGHFTISRGAKTDAHVVVAQITSGGVTGRGECVPYARYGETVEGVVAEISAQFPAVRQGITRAEINARMAPGAARNALDCALWDLAAKSAGMAAPEMAGIGALAPVETAYTLSLDKPDAMAAAARAVATLPLLKLKLGAEQGDRDRLTAVRQAAPDARLIVDANEGWSEQNIEAMLAACAEAGVALVEQPLPVDADGILSRIERIVPVCADESVHGLDTVAALRDRYDVVNIKLDKTGGLTEALAVADTARAGNFQIMTGCMLATSLAMAPAFLLARHADFVDLDGPLLLQRDREGGFRYEGGVMHPASTGFWGD